MLDELVVSLRRFCLNESFHVVGRRRQPGEIETEAANERHRISDRRRPQAFAFLSGSYEGINRIASPLGIRGGNRWPPKRRERPVRLVDSSFVDPAANPLDLLC